MRRLIEQHPLRRGAHPTRELGMCAMEMVAWLAGEPHSDEPSCTCPVLAALVRACNDTLSDEARNRHLRPLLPLLVNTRGSAACERARGLLAQDVLVRKLTPALLRQKRRHEEANLLASLPPIETTEALRAALRAMEHYARDQHAAMWVLQRSLDDVAPARFVAGVVQVAKALNDDATWLIVVDLIAAMARYGRAAEQRAASESAD
ncbi:MAG: hypothetical protein IT456_12195 [Planctomycetes bacterium]|nr:hypothetical protein [Planctomycetota bacterium]